MWLFHEPWVSFVPKWAFLWTAVFRIWSSKGASRVYDDPETSTNCVCLPSCPEDPFPLSHCNRVGTAFLPPNFRTFSFVTRE